MADERIIKTSREPYAKLTVLNSTSTAVSLGDPNVVLDECALKADPANTVNVLVGTATVQSWVLEPGDELPWGIRNPALLYGRLQSAGTANVATIGRKGD